MLLRSTRWLLLCTIVACVPPVRDPRAIAPDFDRWEGWVDKPVSTTFQATLNV